MSNDNSTGTLQRNSFANNYASRLLNRVLNDRKKADGKLTVAEAEKFAPKEEAKELVSSK
jgi:hypothetical protein